MHRANLRSASLRLAFIICLIRVSFPSYIYADVLFGKPCHEAIHKYLKEAETSITLAMYFIIINPTDKTNPVNELINDIIGAHNRGVQVKVVLEDSKLKANRLAYEKLKKNNIAVYFDTQEHL